jgi:lantibiotic biosynthesis protein
MVTVSSSGDLRPPEQDGVVWHVPGLLAARQRDQAAAAAVTVCDRLRDPQRVVAATRLAADQSQHGIRSPCVGPGLAQGWAGIALLLEYADRCRPGEGWAHDAQDALGRSAQAVRELGHLPPGLAAGWSGIAFASTFLARSGQRYGRWCRELHPCLDRAGAAMADSVTGPGETWPFADFDHISGLAGTVAGLLSSSAAGAVREVAGALVTGTLRGGSGPVWPTAADQIGDESLRARYPAGLVNLGLAHGVAGVVAALALAVRDGVAGPEGEVALGAAASWLAGQVRSIDGLPTLPHFSSLGERCGPVLPGRTAWCYGPPGAAGALALAGSVLGRPELIQLGTELLIASLAQPPEIARLRSPTLCHGVAGVLQIAARMTEDSGDRHLAELIPPLCARLLDAFEPDSLLGFRDREAAGNPVDNPALLDGAAGVALVLLSVAHQQAPDWDRAFLLS